MSRDWNEMILSIENSVVVSMEVGLNAKPTE